MTSPVWTTAAGTIGTFIPGEVMFPVVLVARPQAPAISVSYQIIGGSLPSGVNMSSLGVISGTPSNSLNDVVFSFVVRATDNLGGIADRGFSIKISNNNPIWITAAGSIGVFASGIATTYQLIAIPVLPSVAVSYSLLSGAFPSGLAMDDFGSISGTPDAVFTDTLTEFVIRATDTQGNIRDRTFTITVTGTSVPSFDIPAGSLFSIQDSIWIELPITYVNPVAQNEVTVRLIQGALPEGLEINNFGLIRGYPAAPVQSRNYPSLTTISTATNASNVITCFSTSGFASGRPVVFSGTVFGGLVAGQTYYVREITSSSTFTISSTAGGPEESLLAANGFMTVTLPSVVAGQPTIKTSTFVLELVSLAGNDFVEYSITVINQNLPISQGGPGLPSNTRQPTILNTRPKSYNYTSPPELFGYYALPDNVSGETYPPTVNAYIGRYGNDILLAFKVLGYDFDNNQLIYNFSDIPSGFSGDVTTGWLTGTTSVSDNSIIQFSFKVAVVKSTNPAISSPLFSFSFNVSDNLSDVIVWKTDSNLGTINNGSVSIKSIEAYTAQNIPLTYVTSDLLPPNLTLNPNGDIVGVVAYQPETIQLQQDDSFDYDLTVTAFSEQFPIITSTKKFTLRVLTEFQNPNDTLYIKCSPSIEDRILLRSLLEEPPIVADPLIPESYLYRPEDPNFGKASSVIYAHAYGINASAFEEYVAAVTKNHYWRDLTLGQIETAQARDEQGNVVYEVVYSLVIDNLVNPDRVSISEEIYWPVPIDLHLGPWYTSITDIYTSYGPIDSLPTYYTSLTSGTARVLYPNSLPNMRDRVGQVLGQNFNSQVLPLWMISQQENGSTLGFVPAWVICYTKPGHASIIKNNIETKWRNEVGQLITLNQIDFQIDRFYVDKSLTYDYEKNLPEYTVLTSAVEIDSVTIMVADTYLLGNEGYIRINAELISYSQLDRTTNVLYGLKRGLNGTIPQIHQIGDQVYADLSYWANLPSGTPQPDPIDSKDFYVLFPRKTILPTETQY